MRTAYFIKSLETLNPEYMNKDALENTIASLQMIVGYDHFGETVQKLAATKLDVLIEHSVERSCKEEIQQIKKDIKAAAKGGYCDYTDSMNEIDKKLQIAREHGLEHIEINDTFWVWNKEINSWEPAYE